MEFICTLIFIGAIGYLIHRKVKNTRIKAKRWNTQRKRNKEAGVNCQKAINDNYENFVQLILTESPGKHLIPENGFYITKGGLLSQYLNVEIIVNHLSERYRDYGVWDILRKEMKETTKYYDFFHLGSYNYDFGRALEYICKRIFYDFEWKRIELRDDTKELIYEMDIRFYIRKESYYNDIEIIKEKYGYCKRLFEIGYDIKNFTFYDISEKMWQ